MTDFWEKIMKRVLLIAAFVLLNTVCAQVQPATPPADPLDPTPYLIQIERDGVPTPTVVQKLKEIAVALFEAGNFKDAIPALDAHRKSANWLSNLIAAGIEPFYSASVSDRRNIPGSVLDTLVPFETLSNNYKLDRDHSSVMLAEAYAKVGDKSRAIATYLAVLDIISVKDRVWWDRARLGLYALLEVK